MNVGANTYQDSGASGGGRTLFTQPCAFSRRHRSLFSFGMSRIMTMTTGRKLLIAIGVVVCVPLVLILAFVISAVIYYQGHDNLASFTLSRGHTLRVFNDRKWDSSYGVFCQLDGPALRHTRQLLAAIKYPDVPPHFTLHASTNMTLFWITADTRSNDILYVLDISTGKRWPNFDEDSEQRRETGKYLLAVANTDTQIYNLIGELEDIGIKK